MRRGLAYRLLLVGINALSSTVGASVVVIQSAAWCFVATAARDAIAAAEWMEVPICSDGAPG